MAKSFSSIGNKEPTPLPLELDESVMSLKGKKTLKFKLLSVPTNAASAKVEKEITLIYWVKDVRTVLTGLNLTTGPDQDNLVQQVLTGQALTSYMGSLRDRPRSDPGDAYCGPSRRNGG